MHLFIVAEQVYGKAVHIKLNEVIDIGFKGMGLVDSFTLFDFGEGLGRFKGEDE